MDSSSSDSRLSVRWKLFWALFVAALIIAASCRSSVASPGISNFDTAAHFSVYGFLATLVCRIGRRSTSWRGAALTLVVVSAFGVSDEWHQSFVPGRSCEVTDWAADTVGAAVAIALYAGWGAYRRLLERPLWGQGSLLMQSAKKPDFAHG